MKRYALIISIALIVIGFITARVGDSLSTVNENGIIQDNMLMPIGAILFFLGFFAVAVAMIWFLVDFIKSRVKKETA